MNATVFQGSFPFYDASQWSFIQFFLWAAAVILSIEITNWAVTTVPKWLNAEPIKEILA